MTPNTCKPRIIATLFAIGIACAAMAQTRATSSVTSTGGTAVWDAATVFSKATENTTITDQVFYAGVNDEVMIEFSKHDGSYSTLYNKSNKYIQFYASNTVKISVPHGMFITKIVFQETNKSDYNHQLTVLPQISKGNEVFNHPLSYGDITWTGSNSYRETWNGKASVLVLTNKGQIYITSISVTYSNTQAQKSGEFTISDARYSTYYNETGYFMPLGCTGYSVEQNTGAAEEESCIKLVPRYEAGYYVPSKAPLIIGGPAGHYDVYKFDGAKSMRCEDEATNLLHGDAVQTKHDNTIDKVASGRYYQLSYGSEGSEYADVLGFYWQAGSDEGRSINNAANRCYLFMEDSKFKGAPQRGFTLNGMTHNGQGDATGIQSAQPVGKRHGGVPYNLQGQQVGESYHGIVILDGKKIRQ